MKLPITNDQMEGLLLIDKPAGRTSFSLIRSLRKLTQTKKIGHAGTLDPFATGVMVMLIGREYTRLSDQLLTQDKEYLAKLSFGVTTDTFDCEGKVVARSKKVPTLEEIEQGLIKFQGEIEQVPPMFSAKKVQGKKLYELARKGVVIERASAKVQVFTELLEYSYPHLLIRVVCSKGTYIRSLAHDLGCELGCGAHLSELRRTRSGIFTIDSCLDGALLDDTSLDISTYLRHEDHFKPRGI